jgi:diketogulonate reductase-like aldo/keto reductase
MSNVPQLELSSGKKIPQVGLGLWRNILPSHVDRAVAAAIEAGYTHFDSAQIYRNEKFLASALNKAGAKREKVFITTKIWNGNQAEGRFEKSLKKSLQKLDTEYVDLLLLHFPVTETRRGAWRRMEQAYRDGKAQSIGVSNYTIRHLEELLAECEVKPMVNQVELHVFLQQPELVEFCKKHGIVIEAYSPLAHGYGLDNPVSQSVADKHGKSTAQVMLRWCVQMNTVILPKSTHAERIVENINVFDFKLDKDDMELLKKLDENKRTCWDPTHIA